MTSISLPCPAETGLAGAAQRMAGQLAGILAGLRQVVGGRAGRDGVSVPLVLLVCHRLARVLRRFDALVARMAAGRPAPLPRIRAARVRVATPEKLRLPRARGWLMRMMIEAGAARSQLEYLLADPDVADLLAAEPAARRILEPVLGMLGISMPIPRVRLTEAEAAAALVAQQAAEAAWRAGVGIIPAITLRPFPAPQAAVAEHKPPWQG